MYDHDKWMRGVGFEPVREEGPFKVFQRGELIGTVPAFPVRSTSGIFDVRPGDFKLVERDGERVLEASGMIGPGDFACIEGFKPADGVPDCYSDRSDAEMFDVFTEAGMNRAEAIEATIEELLSWKKL